MSNAKEPLDIIDDIIKLMESFRHSRLASIKVCNLFGRFNYTINLNKNIALTILTSPNGFGKTTLMKLTCSLFSNDIQYLTQTPFREFEVTFEDESYVRVVKIISDGASGSIDDVTWFHPEFTKQSGESVLDVMKMKSAEGLGINENDSKIRMSPSRYLDELISTNQPMSKAMVSSISSIVREDIQDEHYGGPINNYSYSTTKGRTGPYSLDIKKLFLMFQGCVGVLHIPSDRLFHDQKNVRQLGSKDSSGEQNLVADNGQLYSVHYISWLAQSSVASAVRRYFRTSREIERNFKDRVLATVNNQGDIQSKPSAERLAKLRQMEEEISQTDARFREIGLLVDKETHHSKSSKVLTNAALSVLEIHFLDIQRKYATLDDIASSIELFLNILNSSFLHKTVRFSMDRGLSAVDDATGKRLPLTKLSSGEQHLLVLYGRLIFDDQYPLVIMDEPEISLHLAWQMNFLDHMEKIIATRSFDLIIATHSPMLIAGRDELLVELSDMVYE